jgi:hypothetical protein
VVIKVTGAVLNTGAAGGAELELLLLWQPANSSKTVDPKRKRVVVAFPMVISFL